MEDKDPFAEFGGTQVSATSQDPFAEFGGKSIGEKKNSTPSLENGSPDLSEPVKQDIPLSSENTEPIDLPASYQSDRANYKDLVSGGSYKLLRGGKPIVGVWDAASQQFIKKPLLDYTVKPKEKGIVEGLVNQFPVPESEEQVLGRVKTDVDVIKQDAADKFVSSQYLSSFQPIQQLDVLNQAYSEEPTEELKSKIDALKSKKLNDTDFEGVRLDNDQRVYQGVLPAPRVGEQLVPFEGELPKLPKTDMTVGDAYNMLQDDKQYIQQATEEIQKYNSFVNDALVKKLPEDKQQYLSSLTGTPMYEEELIKSLEQSNDGSNVAIAYMKGLEHSLNGIYEAGLTIGLDEKQVYEKMLTEYNKEKLFGYVPETTPAQLANSLGGLTPDIAAGAINPALFIASFGSRTPEEQLKNYYFDKISKGETPNYSEGWKYATASTALQGGLMLGAGLVGGAPANILGETFAKRGAEILTEVAKRAGKDALVFGAGGNYLQNKINEAYGVAENNNYLKSMLDMGVIGAAMGLVHLSPQSLKSKISAKTKNDVTDMASYLPANYVNELIKNGVDTGKLSQSEANDITNRMALVRKIASEIPKELSLDEVNELVPLYEIKDKLSVQEKDASPTIKESIREQIKDLDRKILIKAAIPLSADEKAERATLIRKEATGEGEFDKVRLKYLNDRDKAVKQGKEQAKANEVAEELGYDHAKHLLNDIKKQGLGEFETVQEVPKKTLDKVKEERVIDGTNLTLSEAVKFIDDHAVQPNIQKNDYRPNFGLSSSELEIGLRHIKDGKLETVSAKKVLSKISEWKDKGYVDMLAGGGGNKSAMSKVSIPFDISKEAIELSNEQLERVGKIAEEIDKGIDSVIDKFTDTDGNLDKVKLAKELEEAKGGLYFGELLGLSEKELSNLQNLLQDEKSIPTTESTNTKGGSEAGNAGEPTKGANIFDKIEEAKRAKKTVKGKLEAVENAAKEFGEQGKRALEIETNFKSLVERLKSMTDENGEPLLKVKC